MRRGLSLQLEPGEGPRRRSGAAGGPGRGLATPTGPGPEEDPPPPAAPGIDRAPPASPPGVGAGAGGGIPDGAPGPAASPTAATTVIVGPIVEVIPEAVPMIDAGDPGPTPMTLIPVGVAAPAGDVGEGVTATGAPGPTTPLVAAPHDTGVTVEDTVDMDHVCYRLCPDDS